MRPPACCLPTASMTEGTAHERSTYGPADPGGVASPCRRYGGDLFSSVGGVRPFSLERRGPDPDARATTTQEQRYARGATGYDAGRPDPARLAVPKAAGPGELDRRRSVRPGVDRDLQKGLATSHGLSTAKQPQLFAMTSLIGG